LNLKHCLSNKRETRDETRANNLLKIFAKDNCHKAQLCERNPKINQRRLWKASAARVTEWLSPQRSLLFCIDRELTGV